MADQNAHNSNLSSIKRDLLEKILKGKKGWFEEDQIRPFKRSAAIPASFAQKRLWLLDQLYPQSFSYNVPYVLRLKGPLHIEAMKNSLQELVKRHESLRTSFIYEDEKIVQTIAKSLVLDIACVDLSHLAEGEKAEESMRQMTIAAQIPFSLATGPLIRAQLLRITSTDHYLFLNFHHIITDGWSETIFFKELQLLYRRFVTRDISIQLPELPLQYADYTLWQYDWLKGEVFDTQLAYWTNQLRGELPVLALPYDHPRPASKTYNGARLDFSFSHTLLQALKYLSRQEDASLYMVMLAAFNILLYRYTRQDDILVAAPIANRNRREWEAVLGFFANTIILRTDLSGNPSFRDILRRVRTITLDAYAHQDIPFEQLVEKLSPDRDLSMNPIFQIMLNLYEAPEDIQFEGMVAEFIDLDNRTAKFDLEVGIVEKADGLHGELEYSTDLFDEMTMKRLIEHYRVVLAAMVQDPNQAIDSFDLLTEEEQHQFLEWNATDTSYPENLCLHHLFEQQVIQSPDERAVIFANQSLTYRELNRHANGLAKLLREHNVGPEICVGVCIPRSLEMVVAVLGILKAGGAYVPLDPQYPQERLQYIVDDAHITLVLTKNQLSEHIGGVALQHIHLDQIWDKLELIDESIDACTPDNLLYLIYTSGSTGKPKGVALTHRPLVNLIAWQEKKWIHAKKVRCLQFSSLSFDLSCFEFFTTFATGSTLIIPEDEVRDNPERLLHLLIDQKVERACFPYVGLQQIAEVAVQSNISAMVLKEIVVSGEQLHLSPQIVSLLERLDACVLHNHYGPSETHVVTTYPILRGQERQVLPPIGHPIANTQLYVLDSQLHPVPIGVQGELYIAGISLARSYTNYPNITGERFIPNPFSSEPGARMYRSGDLVRYLPDGDIQFFGRLDHQVKIRGFRVEPGEIEATLQLYPGVTKATVIARKYAPSFTYLTAYYVADQEIPGSELRAYLLTRLPEYMVPTLYMQIEAMPLTPSGKINRLAFPVPERKPSDPATWAAPATPVEQQVADIWSKVLGLAHIGRDDQFFQLGGHSLVATQIIARIRNSWKVEVPLRLIFEAPVLKDFAHQIEQSFAPTARHIIQAPRLLRQGPNLLSFAQERLWFFDQLKPGDPAYNLDYAVHIKGALNVAMLEWSLNGVIHRHEVLRTRFQTVNSRPEQIIVPDLFIPLALVDMQRFPDAERMPQALQLAVQVVQQPFDLSQGPLIRALVYQIAEQEFLLVAAMHHIISDGWSMNLFSRELFDLYESRRTATTPVLAGLPIQYADFARWQREWLAGDVLQEQLSFWKQQLRGPLLSTNLPLDYPRPPVQSHQGSQVSFTLSNLLTGKIHRLCEQEGISPYMVLLAVFGTLLYRYTGQEDLLIGTPIANRNRQEIEGLIGFFVNTLVLRIQVVKSMTWKELLYRVKQVALDAYAHQDIPFEKVVEEIQPERDLSTSPLFQIMFNMQNTPRFHQRHGMLSITPLTLDCKASVFDLSMSLEEIDDMLFGTVEYCTDLFREDTIHRLIGHYEMLLTSLVTNVNQQLWQASMLTEAEKQQLLIDWNQTGQPYPDTECIHHLFERQAENTPDALVLSYDDRQLTYKALNERANQLAHHLQTIGVQPEVLVGLYVERSLDFIVGMLAILKAGAAFVPLDPTYPVKHIAFLLQEAKVLALLTQTTLLQRLPKASPQLICLDTWGANSQIREANPQSDVTPSHLAYVIYTSGSTGNPKGVSLHHGGLVNLAIWHQRNFHILPTDRASQLAGPAFDASIWEIWPYLCSGASLHLVEEEVRLSPALVRDWLIERAISIAFLPTPLAEATLMLEWPEQLALRTMLTGGDRLHSYRPASLPFTLVNNYGPTENTAVTTAGVVASRAQPGSVPSIGRPIANNQVYILDHQLQPVPVGVVGELYIGGTGLARGYLFKPELTATSFIPHPFSEQPGARLYRTGDLVRYLPDQSLEFWGRVDFQVKVRGYRIELGAIEAILQAYPNVGDVVVVLHEESKARKYLVAYLVILKQEEGVPTVQQLQTYLREQLPDHMIPTSFVFLPSLPISTNGKVDRKMLPPPDRSQPTGEAHIAPRSQMEQALAQIWQEVLGLKQIGIHENFFSLGGHSLLATQVISQIRSSLGLEVTLKLMFQSPTIAELAAAVQHLEKNTFAEPQIVRRSGVRRTIQK